MDPFMRDFMQKEQKKREKNAKDNETFLLNQNAQRFVMSFHSKINLLENESEVLSKVNRVVSHGGILRLQYRNNFESVEVLAAQLELLDYLKQKYTDIHLNGLNQILVQRPFSISIELHTLRSKWKQIIHRTQSQ